MANNLSLRERINIALLFVLIIGVGLNLYWSYTAYNATQRIETNTDTVEMSSLTDSKSITPYQKVSEDKALAPDFDRPVKLETSNPSVGKYRDRKIKINRTQAVLYKPETVYEYIKDTFNIITEKYDVDLNRFRWEVGFYFYLNDDKKLNFCVVPTLVDKTVSPNVYLDYFDEKIRREYYKLKNKNLADDDETVYNFGHLYPFLKKQK